MYWGDALCSLPARLNPHLSNWGALSGKNFIVGLSPPRLS
jgi:hypothetical protein